MTRRSAYRYGKMPSASRQEEAVRRIQAKRAFRSMAILAAVATVVLNVVWAASGGGDYWPMWAMIAFLVSLVFAGWRAYGRQDSTITDEEIDREMARRPRP